MRSLLKYIGALLERGRALGKGMCGDNCVPKQSLGTRERARADRRAKAAPTFHEESVDATTYGVLLTGPTLCVVPSAGFVTTRSLTRASLEIAPLFAEDVFVSSARIGSRLMSKSSGRICA
jgi:hypothetical protein